jgi:hypothetical protein
LSHLPRLKDHQLALLQRVADGSPVTSSEWTLATSVYALRSRRLVTTPRSGGSWTAVITAAGRFYLEHGDYAPSAPPLGSETEPTVSPPKVSPPAKSLQASPKVGMGGSELVARLCADGGEITIVNPQPSERHRWRRAIHEATSQRLAPTDRRVTHTGRDKGDLVIRLVPTQQPEMRPRPAPVPVPERLGRAHPIIATTRQTLADYKTHTGMIDTRRGSRVLALKTSRALIPRTMRIANALFNAAELRGLTVDARADGLATIGAKGHNYLVTISEITQRRPYEHSKAEIDRCSRYGYDPYPRHLDSPTGDLQLVLPQSWGHSPALRWRWRDTSRWKLEDKLGDVLDGIEARIDTDEQRRLEAERQAILRREAEERAHEQARVRWIEDQRAAALVEQVESWTRATHIRAWITAVEATRPEPDPALTDWLAWADTYAEHLDTTRQAAGFPDIPEPQAADLQPYLSPRRFGTRASWPSLP